MGNNLSKLQQFVVVEIENLSARNQLESVGDVDKSSVSLIVGFD